MSIYQGSIDDNDPQIIYSDGWVLVTSDGDWTGTMHSTSNIGASARVRFTGTRIAFICTIPTGDGQLSQASFSVDGGAAVRVAHATTPPVQWQTTFWDSGPLPYGSHLVTMTNTGNQAYLRLDRIDYDPTTANAPSVLVSSTGGGNKAGPTATSTVRTTLTSVVVLPDASDTQSSSMLTASAFGLSLGGQSSQHSSASLTSSDPTANSSSSPTNPATGPSSSSSSGGAGAKLGDADSDSAGPQLSNATPKAGDPVAAIVGGVLGGLLALVLLVLVLLYRRRKRRAARGVYRDDSGATDATPSSRWTTSTVPTPFGVDRRLSREIVSTSNLLAQTQAGSENSHGRSPSSPFFDSRGMLSASASVYPSESSSSSGASAAAAATGGSYGTQQYQHGGHASSSKHAEFVAEQQQQPWAPAQTPVAGVSVTGDQQRQYGHAASGLGDPPSSVGGTYQDHEAPPPAYPGVAQDAEASPGSGSGWKS